MATVPSKDACSGWKEPDEAKKCHTDPCRQVDAESCIIASMGGRPFVGPGVGFGGPIGTAGLGAGKQPAWVHRKNCLASIAVVI
ncbi:hypothetical protein HaLaN_17592 [Haematococcus lacustris]|uniref:Uncharacterized protein n=1 Tax=Haematococcus lacustris TaxID=44745 RepID=A0A699ZNG1_HAELA|nr:hypothetical protein HaLaN_17592 [Haematococcus lacustris]